MVDDDVDILAALGGPRDPDSLPHTLERSVLMAGRRRRALAVLSIIGLAAAGWLVVRAFTADTGLNLGGGDASGITLTQSEGFATPESVPLSSRPTLADSDGAVLDNISVVAAGDGPVIERVQTDPDLTLLAADPGTLRVYGLTFNTQPHAALVGPPQWFTDACIQLHVAIAGDPVYSTWVAGSAGACRSQGVGTPAIPVCAGDAVLVVPLLTSAEISEDVTSWTIAADVFRTELPDNIELALLSGTVVLDRPPTALVAAGARSGEVLTLQSPSAPSVECLVE